jgi:pSer/pThr/pTyr-binding forkhead associated (FHA) protein
MESLQAMDSVAERDPESSFVDKQRKIKSQLILVKGEGFASVSYKLCANNHRMGRLTGTILFPDDPYLSPSHANIYYNGDQLYLCDENSVNGVFVKLKNPTELKHGDCFLTGEQLLCFELVDTYEKYQGFCPSPEDDAKFYGCVPDGAVRFRLVHKFRDGGEGAVLYYNSSLRIGREHCDLSFPFDRHISGRHARIYEEDGKFYLQDTTSKNGTFLRITEPYELLHGDYFFAGQQLFRVEIESAIDN